MENVAGDVDTDEGLDAVVFGCDSGYGLLGLRGRVRLCCPYLPFSTSFAYILSYSILFYPTLFFPQQFYSARA